MRRFLLFLLLLFAGPLPIQAETVTLPQALQEAVAARPFAAAARQEAAAAKAAVGEARSRYLPRLTLSERFAWTDEPAGSLFIDLNQEDLVVSPDADVYNFPPSRRDFETRLTLEQPLFDPDLAFALRRAGKAQEAAGAESTWQDERAAFAAFAAYLEVQRAQGALAWVESSRREAEEAVRLAARRQEAGVGLKADLLRARVHLAEAERRQVTAGNDLVLARRALALAMGRAGSEVEIAAPLSPRLLQGAAEGPLERADLRALARQAEEAALAHRQSRGEYLPRAGLTAAFALHDAGAPFGTDAGSWSLGAGLTWELFDGWRRSHGLERTAARQQAAESRHLEAYRQALLAVEEAKMRAAEAEQNLATARQAVAEAEESRRLTTQRYEAGLTDLADLLAAQAALDRARFDVAQAESRYLFALGSIPFQRGTFIANLLPKKEGSQ